MLQIIIIALMLVNTMKIIDYAVPGRSPAYSGCKKMNKLKSYAFMKAISWQQVF